MQVEFSPTRDQIAVLIKISTHTIIRVYNIQTNKMISEMRKFCDITCIVYKQNFIHFCTSKKFCFWNMSQNTVNTRNKKCKISKYFVVIGKQIYAATSESLIKTNGIDTIISHIEFTISVHFPLLTDQPNKYHHCTPAIKNIDAHPCPKHTHILVTNNKTTYIWDFKLDKIYPVGSTESNTDAIYSKTGDLIIVHHSNEFLIYDPETLKIIYRFNSDGLIDKLVS